MWPSGTPLIVLPVSLAALVGPQWQERAHAGTDI
jgi:hypothetical protein